MTQKIIIGTRGSRLALTQTEMVKNLLLAQFPDLQIDIKIIETSGDIHAEANLAEIGGKELFTKEIDEALYKGEIDVAVHSLKDVPGILSDKQQIFAVLKRADVRDAILGAKSIADIPQNAVVGTSSPRRKFQILALRPDLKIVPFRGNVPTRIKKLEDKIVDATLLAMAGMERLGINASQNAISINEMLPAAGQGIIAINGRSNDSAARKIVSAINHIETFVQATAERAVLKTFGGNCYTPIAAHAELSGAKIKLSAFVANEDGTKSYKISRESQVDDAENLGIEIGKILLEKLK
jgi:hydroxymethylbilane synthase